MYCAPEARPSEKLSVKAPLMDMLAMPLMVRRTRVAEIHFASPARAYGFIHLACSLGMFCDIDCLSVDKSIHMGQVRRHLVLPVLVFLAGASCTWESAFARLVRGRPVSLGSPEPRVDSGHLCHVHRWPGMFQQFRLGSEGLTSNSMHERGMEFALRSGLVPDHQPGCGPIWVKKQKLM